jgi:hypothetical protein
MKDSIVLFQAISLKRVRKEKGRRKRSDVDTPLK